MGQIFVQVRPDGVIESRGEGVITPVLVQEWADKIRIVRAGTRGGDRLLFDALEIDVFVPGSAIIAVRSARQHAGRTAATAFVTRNPSLIGLGGVLAKLMPAAPRAIFGSRSEALAFLDAVAPLARVGRL